MKDFIKEVIIPGLVALWILMGFQSLAFSAKMECYTDEGKSYKFDVKSTPYIERVEWHTGKNKGLITTFNILSKENTYLVHDCSKCSVKYKREYNMLCYKRE
jgi:hypothetical protein